jgi:hypothetical protein
MDARQETIDRYRHLREVAKQHVTGALKHLSKNAINGAARRVGLLSGGAIVADSFDEMTLAFDLAVLGPQPGRSRAIDRYARAHPPAPGSDEALALDALRHCRFHIIRVLRRHETAGLVVEDVASHEELWLMDEGLETTAPEGAAFGTRLLRLDGFHMTAGAAVPVTGDVLEAAIASRPVWLNDAQFRFIDDPRFPEALYAAAIRHGKMQFMKFKGRDEVEL